MTKDEILSELREVRYPGFSRDIVSFGIVKDAADQDGKITVTLTFTTESPEKRGQIQAEIARRLRAKPGIHTVGFASVDAPVRPAAERSVLERRPVAGVKHLVAVASGKGGVGKSTVAVNLACSLQKLGRRAGLLDADIYGPSVPLMMGVGERPGLTGENRIIPHVRHGVSLMSIGFFVEGDNPVIWRGPMVTGAIRQLLNDTQWEDLDYLIIDLPPGTGDAQLSLVQMAPVSGAVVVTTPQDVALIDAAKGVVMFQKLDIDILGIIENMSYFICPDCGKKSAIFSEGGGRREASRLGVPFLGEIPIDPAIRSGGDEGIPVVVRHPESNPAKAFLAAAKAVDSTVLSRVS